MTKAVPASLRSFVRERAGRCCEYGLLPEEAVWVPHEPDHVVAAKHRGRTEEGNLAWTCLACNRHKGTDLTSIDPQTGRIVRLFNPRLDDWQRHFRLEEGRIIGRTAIGRVTEFLLKFNRPARVRLRRTLIAKGLYPP